MTRRIAPVACVLLSGCAGVQTQLDPAGDQAAALHQLFVLMMTVCGVFYVLVIAALAWSLCRARRAAGTTTDDRSLERWLRLAGIGIVAGLTILIVGSFIADRALYAARGERSLTVRVTGHQWWWRIEYRDPASGRWIETANELHLPLGRTTHVLLGSADVIHSFWVPNVSGKIDMVPGRANRIDLTPRRIGWFRGQCAEFCGVQHAHMALDVKVEAPATFAAWLAGQAAPATAGDATFAGACGSCHAVRGTEARGRAGPDLTHLATRRSIAAGALPMTRGGLQGWIQQPQAIKPGTAMPAVPLAPTQAIAIADYLAGLR